MESEWEKFQTQLQQMQEVRLPLLVHLAFDMLLSIIDILALVVRFIPQSHGHSFLGLS